jgi:hypothetical protein
LDDTGMAHFLEELNRRFKNWEITIKPGGCYRHGSSPRH